MIDELDPRTPILVGVGQISDPIDAPGYRQLSAVGLAAAAAQTALEDAGIDPAIIDTVAGVRQFEISTPRSSAPLGRSNNYPRSVAARVGADPRRAILEVAGGQSPQHLITELAKAIAAGEASAVLIFGSEAISTTRAFGGREDAPDFSEHVGGTLDDRGYGLEGLTSKTQVEHGLIDAPSQHCPLRQCAPGTSRVGRASTQPPSATCSHRSQGRRTESVRCGARRTNRCRTETVTDRNRLISDPYPRFVVARDQVNQGAAVVLTSVGVARAGIPEHRWVFLHGYADLREKNLLDRPDLSAGPASVLAAYLCPGARRNRGRPGGHLRPVQLLPDRRVQHLRRAWAGSHRPARTHPHRWTAILRRCRKQLLHAPSPRQFRDFATTRVVRVRRGKRWHAQQVLRRCVLHDASGLAGLARLGRAR